FSRDWSSDVCSSDLVIASICGLLGPFFLQIGIDNYIVKGDYQGLTLIALAFLSTNFINMLCMKQRVRIMSNVGQNILFKLRQDRSEERRVGKECDTR